MNHNQNQRSDNQNQDFTFKAPRTELYGYLFIALGIVFVLFWCGLLPLLNIVIGLTGVGMILYGAYRIHLVEKIRHLVASLRRKK